jgi:hypothetical protein
MTMDEREPGIYVGGELVLPAADPDQIEADLAAELAHDRARDALYEAVRQLDEAWHRGGDHEDEHRALCDAWDALMLAPGPYGTSTGEG